MMKFSLTATTLLLGCCSAAAAFVTRHQAFQKIPSTTTNTAPSFLAQSHHHHRLVVPPLSMSSQDQSEMSLDEEVEQMVQEEIKKTGRISNLRNEKGVEYAPWMNITPEDEAKIRQVVREKAEARRKRREQEQNVKGALRVDSQAQELSGAGLRFKVFDDSEVELEWATSSETSTKGFIVKRRPAKTDEFQVLASYETYGPLASQGKEGGVYRYLDENVAPGGWVYRVTECEMNGEENDLSQCLVELQTQEEQRGTVIGLVALAVVAAAAIAAGTLLDPVQY